MIVEMGVIIEISKPVAAIFIKKAPVALAAAHSNEPGRGDGLSTCLKSSVWACMVTLGRAATEQIRVATRTYFHRVRVIFLRTTSECSVEERGKGGGFQCCSCEFRSK